MIVVPVRRFIFFPSDSIFCILFFFIAYIKLDYNWITNENLNRHHPPSSMRVSPVSCWAIPFIGTGQRKNQDGGKQNGESPCYLKQEDQ